MYTFKLNNGVDIPCIGTGPGMIHYHSFPILGNIKFIRRFANRYQNKCDKNNWLDNISRSIQNGYRLIDYAPAYGEEELLGKAIRLSGIPRSSLFLTSRVRNRTQFNDCVRQSFFETLNKMQIDYLDLYMFHWPVTGLYINTYKEIEKLYKEGYIRAIGVCNCHEHHLRSIVSKCEILPAINQIEVHPLFTQKKLIDYCNELGILVEAYTPLGRQDDRLWSNSILNKLSKKYGKDIAQIILKWNIQQNRIPIPRSNNIARQISNLDIFDFHMSDEELGEIDSININSRLRYDPDNVDFHSIG